MATKTMQKTMQKKNETPSVPQKATKLTNKASEEWDRTRILVSLNKYFGFDWPDAEGKPMKISRFKNPPPPEWRSIRPDSDYVFPDMQTIVCLMALDRDKRNRAWIGGESGTGKSQLLINIFDRINYPFVRVQGSSSASRSRLIGSWQIRGRRTYFQYGPLVLAMKFGAAVIIDEIDQFPPNVLADLRPVLEEGSHLVVEETREVITAHPDFRVFATANTFGAGDETGRFKTTQVLSAADRQRFPLKIVLNYLPAETEIAAIMKEFPDLTLETAEKFVKVANAIRNKYSANEIDEPISLREILAWVHTYEGLGSALAAAHFTFLNGYPSQSAVLAVSELIRNTFPDPTNVTSS